MLITIAQLLMLSLSNPDFAANHLYGRMQPFQERGNGEARRESPAIFARRAAELF
jgi:hypothetical protein